MHRLLRASILIMFGMLIISIIGGCADDDPPEKVMDPPQRKDDAPHSPTITVMVDPPPGSVIDEDRTEFTLRFNQEVVAVTVSGAAATGSGQNWSVWSYNLRLGSGIQHLDVKWKKRDGSTGSRTVGPYDFSHGQHASPVIRHGTVSEGEVNVDPARLNVSGITITFDEDVTGTIKLTDEAGNDLNWAGIVQGERANLTVIAGQELVHETTYKVEINVQDRAGNRTQLTITFVTKPK